MYIIKLEIKAIIIVKGKLGKKININLFAEKEL